MTDMEAVAGIADRNNDMADEIEEVGVGIANPVLSSTLLKLCWVLRANAKVMRMLADELEFRRQIDSVGKEDV